MKTVGILTLGCRVNQYESVAIAEALEKEGFSVQKGDKACDFYIVNTCSVTSESQRQSRQTVRRLASVGKTAVLGCASQNVKEDFLQLENVFYVGGNTEKLAVVEALKRECIASATEKKDATQSMENALYEPMRVFGTSDLFSSCRAYVKIQDGCNGKCSYCIIPTLRGKSRIRSRDEILAEANGLVGAGFREVVLTGIEVSAYPMEEMITLVRELSSLHEYGLERVRFGSLSPSSLKEPFLYALADSENAMPHLHLSLQSGSDRILNLMRRPYLRSHALDGISLAKRILPGVQLSADFITGFPSETEEEYRMTESFVTEAGLMHVHAFPYSERSGTPAAKMENSVPKEVRKERCARLNLVSEKQKETVLQSFFGTEVTVLVEKVKNGYAYGHTVHFIEACFPDRGAAVGSLCFCIASEQKNGVLHCVQTPYPQKKEGTT